MSSSICWSFLYKFILAHIFGHLLLGHVKTYALLQGGIFNLGTLGVMYVFGLDLFFDFAGYSMFALAASNLMGIKSPINFNLPFKSRDLKEFWNRWHMSLSFWFRDFVFMRLVMVLMRNKVFQSRITTSNVAYIINMLVMGFWHGVTWYYVAYGLFHGLGLVINDAWLRIKSAKQKDLSPCQIIAGLRLLESLLPSIPLCCPFWSSQVSWISNGFQKWNKKRKNEKWM